MLVTTIEKVYRCDVDDNPYCIYVARNGDDIFYVGRSVDPCKRLRQHLESSAFGDLIKDNLPQSFQWAMELYTLDDCLPYIARYAPGRLERYKQCIVSHPDMATETAEATMIAYYRPYLNTLLNTRNRPILPDKYVKETIIDLGL